MWSYRFNIYMQPCRAIIRLAYSSPSFYYLKNAFNLKIMIFENFKCTNRLYFKIYEIFVKLKKCLVAIQTSVFQMGTLLFTIDYLVDHFFEKVYVPN